MSEEKMIQILGRAERPAVSVDIAAWHGREGYAMCATHECQEEE